MSSIDDKEKVLPDEQAFWLKKNDATPVARVNSIREMITALRKCPAHVVNHHLREGVNDFAKWVRDCFQDELLASELENLQTDPNSDIMRSKIRILFENALTRRKRSESEESDLQLVKKSSLPETKPKGRERPKKTD